MLDLSTRHIKSTAMSTTSSSVSHSVPVARCAGNAISRETCLASSRLGKAAAASMLMATLTVFLLPGSGVSTATADEPASGQEEAPVAQMAVMSNKVPSLVAETPEEASAPVHVVIASSITGRGFGCDEICESGMSLDTARQLAEELDVAGYSDIRIVRAP